MKKNFFVIVTIGVLVLSLVGCSNKAKEAHTIKVELSKEEKYDLDLAKKAENQQEVLEILERRDSKNFQMALAKSDSSIVQETLLSYDGIYAEALVEICKNPCIPNIYYYAIRNSFISAIGDANLTVEQEIEIVKTEEYPMQLGVLCRQDLSVEALIYLLETNNKFNATLNLNQYRNKEYIVKQIARLDLTLEQKEKLQCLNIDIVNEALLAKENAIAVK